jgi:signal transduction histidine kinase
MTSGSLKFRLYATAAIAIALALGIAAVALTSLFHQQVQLRVRAELGNHMLQLISKVDLTGGETLLSDEAMADPRFDKPYSGLYWTAQGDGMAPVNSRSLWDQTLAGAGTRSAPGRPAWFETPGPDGQLLYVMQETVVAATQAGDRRVVLNIGIDHAELDQAVASFRNSLVTYLGIIAALLLAATWLQVGIGLQPLSALRDKVSAIRSGETRRLDGSYPDEVRPLVEEINELVGARDDSLDKARARAGDLAHALRTPLTVMGSLASDIERAGKHDVADALREQTEVMRRSVERELARARMASGRSTALYAPREGLERMVQAMQRMPRGDEIDWQLRDLNDARVAVDGDDLLELFGNLLDNARKWAHGKVRVSMNTAPAALTVTIEDDGPGVADESLRDIAQRGQRLDETRQGSGLGLAIVSDLASAYGLGISYARSSLGGLAATVSFPLPREAASAPPAGQGVGVIDARLHLDRGNR